MPSTLIDPIVERAAQSLYEDERLRSNLTDAQAQIVLNWASNWLTQRATPARDAGDAQRRVQAEVPRLRSALSALNALPPGVTPAQAIAALGPLAKGGGQDRVALLSSGPLPFEDLLTRLTGLISATWKARS